MATLPSCLPLGPSLAFSLWLWERSGAAQQGDPLGRNWQRFLATASKEPRASFQPEKSRVLSTVMCVNSGHSPLGEPSSEAAAPANTDCSLEGAGTLRHGYSAQPHLAPHPQSHVSFQSLTVGVTYHAATGVWHTSVTLQWYRKT